MTADSNATKISLRKGFVQKRLVLSDSTLKNKSSWHPGGVSGTQVRPRSAVALAPRNNFGFLKPAASPERSMSKSFIKLVHSHKSAPTASHVQEECQKSGIFFLSFFKLLLGYVFPPISLGLRTFPHWSMCQMLAREDGSTVNTATKKSDRLYSTELPFIVWSSRWS